MHPGERRRVTPGREAPLGVVALQITRCPHHGLDVVTVVDAFDLRARRRARREHPRIVARERAEPLERVVDADEALRLQWMIFAIDMHRDARVPDETGRGHLRLRSRVRKLKSYG